MKRNEFGFRDRRHFDRARAHLTEIDRFHRRANELDRGSGGANEVVGCRRIPGGPFNITRQIQHRAGASTNPAYHEIRVHDVQITRESPNYRIG